MKKSALQKARASYQPKLPIALTGPVKAVLGKATQSVANQEEIQKLFPQTYGLPELHFEKNLNPAPGHPINVGVILSGGQAPGGHNVISESNAFIAPVVFSVSLWDPAGLSNTSILN